MPGPQSWDWDDDSLLPRREDYSEAEIHRMQVAADRRRRGHRLLGAALTAPGYRLPVRADREGTGEQDER